jgi:hypothetical protein
MEGLVPDGLCHSCASLATSAGANVMVVQRMRGHAQAVMPLDLCGQLLNDDLSGVAEALGRTIECGTKTEMAERVSCQQRQTIS